MEDNFEDLEGMEVVLEFSSEAPKEFPAESFGMEVLREPFARNKIAYHRCGNGNPIRKSNRVNLSNESVIGIFPTRDKKGIGISPWVPPFETNPFTCCWKLKFFGKPQIVKIDHT